jgi:flagellar motor switch/type III secretory pathway protein FliN
MSGGKLRAFSLEGLPRLPRAAAAATRTIARLRARLPEEIAVSLKRVGVMVVRSSWLAFGAPPEEAGVSFSLEVRGERARLTVEPLLSLRLLAAVLGLPRPVAVRPLGRAERGALAAVIAAFLEAARADGSIRVAFDDAGPIDAAVPSVSVTMSVQIADFTGAARLDVPARLLAAPRGGRWMVDPRPLAPRLDVELARTTLSGAEFASAEVADTVVFEGASPVRDETGWPVRIRLGDCSCPGQLDTDGGLRRRGPVVCEESEIEMSSDKTNITAPVLTPLLSEEATRALASAPVEIVAELGRFTVRGEELVGLIEGGVLPLGPRRQSEVVLRAGGRVWAIGELVAVDDDLAVRITQLVK